MTKLLTPQEALQALIDGKDVEYKARDEADTDPDKWWDYLHTDSCPISYLLSREYQFRLAQEMITIGDVSFPKPYQGEMEYNEVYHVPRIDYKSLYNSTRWDGGAEDRMMMSRGLLHLTKESAIAHAKALIRLSGGCVE